MSKSKLIKTVTDILDGYKNYFVPNPMAEDLARQRAEVCAECPFKAKGIHAAVLPDVSLGEINGYYCTACMKCPLSVKVRSIEHECPLKKW